ncbi:hypothetical protein BsIDN1_70950 [Bacillus safensis]|uniref:Uncharacterized protein n=1 Tax=Bacillus safensis TaxID=561879 RepID=A0A5S9MJ68_BACIA|nr:hypothetical protein BsIDN1_70950 [Bacillus safensis]
MPTNIDFCGVGKSMDKKNKAHEIPTLIKVKIFKASENRKRCEITIFSTYVVIIQLSQKKHQSKIFPDDNVQTGCFTDEKNEWFSNEFRGLKYHETTKKKEETK